MMELTRKNVMSWAIACLPQKGVRKSISANKLNWLFLSGIRSRLSYLFRRLEFRKGNQM
jgi:hypothetical protein